jgi:hypothetical protein
MTDNERLADIRANQGYETHHEAVDVIAYLLHLIDERDAALTALVAYWRASEEAERASDQGDQQGRDLSDHSADTYGICYEQLQDLIIKSP